MTDFAQAKQTVLDFHDALDKAAPDDIQGAISDFTADGYQWRGMHPFYELSGAAEVADTYWQPLRASFAPLQRRRDIFLAGENVVDQDGSVWVCETGHLLGLFDQAWLDIPPTHRMCFLRYAEFNRVLDGKIAETAIFQDVISVMRQAGVYPLPPQTGASHIYPGPLTHDGLLLTPQDAGESSKTMDLVHRMADDLSAANEFANATGDNRVKADELRKTWHENMIWYGPEGIGAAYTIDRYQHQHQYPFRFNLTDKQFNGHVARFAEGNYACFFGWPNLTNRATGGFLGMTESSNPAGMRVVDVYRRDGDKLAENWVFMDIPHWLAQQGLDVLQRMRQTLGIEGF